MVEKPCRILMLLSAAACLFVFAQDAFAESELRRMEVSGGGTIMTTFHDGHPVLARENGYRIESIEPLLSHPKWNPSGSIIRWIVTLSFPGHQIPAAVQIADVTGETAVTLATDDRFPIKAELVSDGDKRSVVKIETAGTIVSPAVSHWMYSPETSTRVFRIDIKGERTESTTLYQPMVYTRAGKQSLRNGVKDLQK